MVELAGALLAPAFVDASLDLTGAGLALDALDLSSTSSLADALAAVEARARSRPGDEVLWGVGWNEHAWPERRPPSAGELERAAGPGRAVHLLAADRRRAVVSATLRPDPAEHGLSAGVLHGSAVDVAHRAALARTSLRQRRAVRRRALVEAGRHGVGQVHDVAARGADHAATEAAGDAATDATTDDAATDADVRDLRVIADEGPGPEVVAGWDAPGAPGAAGVRGAVGLGARVAGPVPGDFGGPDDGAASGAAEHLTAATEAGVQASLAVRGAGDPALADTLAGTLTEILAGAETAAGRVGVARFAAARHRVELAGPVDPADARRMARLGLVAVVRPAALAPAAPPPYALLAGEGVALALGSGAPAGPIDPWRAVSAACAHPRPGQSLSARAAFTAHTRGGHRAARRDDGGVLHPGAPATFAVWTFDGDLVVQTPDERIRAWSTDPRSQTPGLPDLSGPRPVCVHTVVLGALVHGG